MWEGDVWVALRAARIGADIVRAGFFEGFETEMKSAIEPVTQIDRDSEEAIMGTIRHHFPDDSVLGEEGGGSDWRQGRVWIVDPLDGTVNFVHGVPLFAVSVALWDDGTPLVGVVIDVVGHDEFVAVAGGGASVNEKPIHVSDTTRLEDSLLVTGFPYDSQEHGHAYLGVMEVVMRRSRGVRRLGAAALDLAWVAMGRFDAYWEHGGTHGIKPWDMAAGALLVTEAGGQFTDHLGRPNMLQSGAFVASNGLIHDDLQEIVAATLPEHLK